VGVAVGEACRVRLAVAVGRLVGEAVGLGVREAGGVNKVGYWNAPGTVGEAIDVGAGVKVPFSWRRSSQSEATPPNWYRK
jgi:hypothetical protein